MSLAKRNHAVVLGGSMAGLLSARALSDHFEHVTVVERDEVTGDGSEPRRGVPQGRHIHVLLARGQQALDEFFPGFTSELQDQGAPVGELLNDTRILLNGHRMTRAQSGLVMLNAARPTLEDAVLHRVNAVGNIEILNSTTVAGLRTSADRRRVTGVDVRSRYAEDTTAIDADFVLDATGRASRTPAWLEQLGATPPSEDRVRVDVGYATRLYRSPDDVLDGDIHCIIGRSPDGTRGGALARIGPETWILTLFGYLGDHPPRDHEGHLAFAHSLPFPDIHEAVRSAEPLDDGASFRFQANTRRRYEKLTDMPDGLAVVGDGLCSFNPIYGQGMTVAALQAAAMAEHLDSGNNDVKAMRRSLAKAVDAPWEQAIGSDFSLEGTEGHRPVKIRLTNPYVARVQAVAARDPEVATAFARVASLVDPPESLLRPRTMLRVLRPSR